MGGNGGYRCPLEKFHNGGKIEEELKKEMDYMITELGYNEPIKYTEDNKRKLEKEYCSKVCSNLRC